MSRSKFYTPTLSGKLLLAFFILILFGANLNVVASGTSREAKKHMLRGQAAMEAAKNASDFQDAIKEFKLAIGKAPKWPGPWFNLGVAQKSAKEYRNAIKSFNKYLKLKPKASDRSAIEDEIIKLEYLAEKKVNARRYKEKPKFPTPEDLAGYWRSSTASEPTLITTSGNWLLFDRFDGASYTSGKPMIKFRLTGLSLENGLKETMGLRGTSASGTPAYSCLQKMNRMGGHKPRTVQVSGTISRDFKRILFRYTDLARLPGCILGNHEFEIEYYR